MITSKQRAYLRGLANTAETIFQIGKGGITDNLVAQVEDALEARELIKLKVLETCEYTPREAAGILAERCGAEPVQCIGARLVLYRESKKNKQIKLPR